MKKLLSVLCVLFVYVAYAEEYNIDLNKTAPMCGTYKITTNTTRKQIVDKCMVSDTHNGRVRIFRGSEKIDITTTNMGNITCKFNRSLVNTDGALKECITTVPPVAESAIVTIKSNASAMKTGESIAKSAK